MKVLIDMNLSPEWVETLRANGIEALHWSKVGHATATDRTILRFAADHNYIVFTHDLDFGIALATSRHAKPSVLQVRADRLLPSFLGKTVVAALLQMREELERGALVTLDVKKLRMRYLPLLSSHEGTN